MNVNIEYSGVDPDGFYILALRAVVDTGGLPSYSTSSDAMSFFKRANVTTLLIPQYFPETSGYNSANQLIGM